MFSLSSYRRRRRLNTILQPKGSWDITKRHCQHWLERLAREAGYGMPIDNDGTALIAYHHAWAKANGGDRW